MDIKEKINCFPKTPGIYMMKDKEDNVIYVGKSKSLQDRIKSYFTNSNSHSKKVQRMVKGIHDIEIITTDTELDALILECEIIKKIKPMYNKLMKNHENYSYMKLDRRIEFPYIQIVKDIEDNAIYFGPYTTGKKLEEIKKIINEVYGLRRCKRMTKCFNYDLKKCMGPCRDSISKNDYNKIIDNLITDLNGETTYIAKILQKEMEEEIKRLNFEKAQELKNKIDKINSLFKKSEIIDNSTKEDILAWIKLNEKQYKIYTIKRGILIKSEIEDINIFKNIDKHKYLEENLKKYEMQKINAENEDTNENNNVEKYDIDFINIIYSYIRYNKDIEYILK
ncbi:GIY-YIG nuclease family protein [Romboutsia sp.]|uniref:GIY-YIG nuclease family protein n=1 Tax=Romboutsia sp. TaxID=1965302 RepID=UPI003F401546